MRGVELFVRRVGQGQPTVVLHGGPGAHHDYLLPGLRRPRRRAGADLLRPARRRPLAGGARRGGGLDRARGRPRRPADGVGPRAADARGILVGWSAGAAVRPVPPRPGGPARAHIARAGVAGRAGPVRGRVRQAEPRSRLSGGAAAAPRERAPRARSRGLPAAHLRAVGGAVLLRPRARTRAHAVPRHRPHPAGGVAEPGRLRSAAAAARAPRDPRPRAPRRGGPDPDRGGADRGRADRRGVPRAAPLRARAVRRGVRGVSGRLVGGFL